MSFDKPWYIDQQPITPKQSPVSTEDILNTTNHIENSQQIRQKTQQIENEEKQDNERNTNDALWITSNNWKDKETYIRESGIDFNQNITKINTKIALIKNKIQILEEKNDLSRDERKMRITFRRELQKLTDKKHTIEINVVGNQNNHKKENLVIVDNRVEKKKENLAIEKEKVIAKIDEISRIVSNYKSQ